MYEKLETNWILRSQCGCLTPQRIAFLFGSVIIWLLYRCLIKDEQLMTSFPVEIAHDDYLLDKYSLDCKEIKHNKTAVEQLKMFAFDVFPYEVQILSAEDRCSTIRNLFEFRTSPKSTEEEAYPLAYGAVIHTQPIQVLLMLSALYEPQNSYCLAVSGSAKTSFKHIMQSLQQCFPNVHVMIRPPISWGSFEIINSTFHCMKYLTTLDNDWEYYQYLSGVDVPLKTNREMVRIFKALNHTVNIEIANYPFERLASKNMNASPLPLYKGSLSALITREAANIIASANESSMLLEFLEETMIPDEAFWTTMTGNTEKLPMIGGMSAQKWLQFCRRMKNEKHIRGGTNMQSSRHGNNITKINEYYISRYQVWEENECHGETTSGSCVFGVEDVPKLLREAALIAHKLYIDFQPAAFFCILKAIKNRDRCDENFEASDYEFLPQVELKRGIPFEKLKHPELIHCE